MPVISFKVSDDELAQVLALAKARGSSPGLVARDIVLRDVGVELSKPTAARHVANRDELRQALGELGRQGSNLNQIARAANSGGKAVTTAADLAAMRAAYEAALDALTSVLGVTRAP